MDIKGLEGVNKTTMKWKLCDTGGCRKKEIYGNLYRHGKEKFIAISEHKNMKNR